MDAGKSFTGRHNNDALLFLAWEILRSIQLWETKSKNYEIVSTNSLELNFEKYMQNPKKNSCHQFKPKDTEFQYHYGVFSGS